MVDLRKILHQCRVLHLRLVLCKYNICAPMVGDLALVARDTEVIEFCFFFFQAEDGIRDLTVTGVQTCALPIYRLIDQIGRGGMGTVWWAHDEVENREVAVKEVHLPNSFDERAKANLIRRTDRERSEEHTSELQSQSNLVCRLLLEKKKTRDNTT